LFIIIDDFIRSMITDVRHHYQDPNLHNDRYMSELFMNYICMRGMKYDAGRLIKRTWVYFVPGKHLDYSKIDPGDLVPEEDSHDWTHIMVEGERNPELLKEFYQTTLKGYVCLRALNICCFTFVFCLLGSKGERLSLRQKQSKQPITNKTKVDPLEEHAASSDSNCEGKATPFIILMYKTY